jgi:hypothetical protein
MKTECGRKTSLWWRLVMVLPIVGVLVLLVLIWLLYDRHRTVTSRMGWQCAGASDTGNARYPHVETAIFWFRDNPRYHETASGPSLCADLSAAGKPDVDMTFDTWGNAFLGLHGYDTVALAANGKKIVLYGGESGGFHDDEPHYGNFNSDEDKKTHPEKYKFPIDTFRR